MWSKSCVPFNGVHPGTTPGVTDFETALATAVRTLQTQPPAADASLFFVSDGRSDSPWSFSDEVEQLNAMGVERVAWAFGEGADVTDLRRLDPYAEHLKSEADIVDRVTARSRSGAGDGRWLEPGLADVTIYLDENGNQQLDWSDADGDAAWDPGEGERWTTLRSDDPATTDEDETGWYAFDDLPIDIHTVREIVPPGYVQTAPLLPDQHQVDLRTGPIATGYDFGNRPLPGGITGLKGLDADDDGVYEDGEPGQAGVTIYLDLNGDGTLNLDGNDNPLEPTAVTGADGQFSFEDLNPGQYLVREQTPEGFEQITPANDQGILVDVPPGGIAEGSLFVNADLRGAILGWKWTDLDGDGERDADEPGLAGVTIYLDANNNSWRDWTDLDGDGVWDPGEGEQWTVSQADDPETPAEDETGVWRLDDVVAGEYTVREISPSGYESGYPGPDGHPVVLPPRGLIAGLLFGNIPILPSIGGWKFDDCNKNGRRDPNRLRGEPPLLVLTVDLSASVQNDFAGEPPGDVNGDGLVNTVLDGELAALIAVNQALIDYGLDATTQIAIVAFGEDASAQDMDPTAGWMQLSTSPSADTDGDGMLDVEQVLRSLQRKEETDYGAALRTVAETISEIGAPPGSANMLFVSDGEPNRLGLRRRSANSSKHGSHPERLRGWCGRDAIHAADDRRMGRAIHESRGLGLEVLRLGSGLTQFLEFQPARQPGLAGARSNRCDHVPGRQRQWPIGLDRRGR